MGCHCRLLGLGSSRLGRPEQLSEDGWEGVLVTRDGHKDGRFGWDVFRTAGREGGEDRDGEGEREDRQRELPDRLALSAAVSVWAEVSVWAGNCKPCYELHQPRSKAR